LAAFTINIAESKFRHTQAHPEAIAEYVKTYNAERRRLARAKGDRERHLPRRAGEIGRELERLVDAIAKGIGDLDAIGPRMKALQQERDQVKAQLAAAAQADQVVSRHPAAVDRYLADIKRLSDIAADAAALDEPELVATLRSLVDAVIVHAPANNRVGGIGCSGAGTHAFPPPPSELFIVIRRERKAA
jgi:site-specific DNA recombinase